MIGMATNHAAFSRSGGCCRLAGHGNCACMLWCVHHALQHVAAFPFASQGVTSCNVMSAEATVCVECSRRCPQTVMCMLRLCTCPSPANIATCLLHLHHPCANLPLVPQFNSQQRRPKPMHMQLPASSLFALLSSGHSWTRKHFCSSIRLMSWQSSITLRWSAGSSHPDMFSRQVSFAMHHTASAPCQLAQTHMPVWHKVINRVV